MTTEGSGRGGSIEVTADRVVLSGVEASGNRSGLRTRAEGKETGSGDGGSIRITTRSLEVQDGATINATSEGPGRGGNIEVTAQHVLLSGVESGRRATIAAQTEALRGGDGGNVRIQTDRLELKNGGQLDVTTEGSGRGGNIEVTAQHVLLDGGSEISARSQSESLGEFFRADPDVGKSGTITLTVGDTLRLQNGSRITVETAQANAGGIALHGGPLLYVQHRGEITTSAAAGQGNGGDITMDAESVVLQDGQIRANAFAGNGGNVRIMATVFLADPDSQVSASSALGIAGTVDIQAPVTSFSGALAPLPQTFVNVAALLPARCAARLSGGRYSSLVLGGRDGLPTDPSGVLPSPLVMDTQLAADSAMIGVPHAGRALATMTLFADQEKALPRLQRDQVAGRCAP